MSIVCAIVVSINQKLGGSKVEASFCLLAEVDTIIDYMVMNRQCIRHFTIQGGTKLDRVVQLVDCCPRSKHHTNIVYIINSQIPTVGWIINQL